MAAQMECTKCHCFTWSDWIRRKYVAVSRLSSKLELERLKIAFSIGRSIVRAPDPSSPVGVGKRQERGDLRA